jgi:hypothetical protein
VKYKTVECFIKFPRGRIDLPEISGKMDIKRLADLFCASVSSKKVRTEVFKSSMEADDEDT